MITYSTTWMGPISLDWYRKRGLTRKQKTTIQSEDVAKSLGRQVGDTVEYDEPTVSYSGGRIDIYGVDPTEYYGGRHEYGLPVMHSEDWGALSHWLYHHETPELWTYDELIDTFERKCLKRKIRWADEQN